MTCCHRALDVFPVGCRGGATVNHVTVESHSQTLQVTCQLSQGEVTIHTHTHTPLNVPGFFKLDLFSYNRILLSLKVSFHHSLPATSQSLNPYKTRSQFLQDSWSDPRTQLQQRVIRRNVKKHILFLRYVP